MKVSGNMTNIYNIKSNVIPKSLLLAERQVEYKANLLLSVFFSPLKFFETDASGIAIDKDLPRVRRWKSSALSPLPTALEPEQKRQDFGRFADT